MSFPALLCLFIITLFHISTIKVIIGETFPFAKLFLHESFLTNSKPVVICHFPSDIVIDECKKCLILVFVQ